MDRKNHHIRLAVAIIRRQNESLTWREKVLQDAAQQLVAASGDLVAAATIAAAIRNGGGND